MMSFLYSLINSCHFFSITFDRHFSQFPAAADNSGTHLNSNPSAPKLISWQAGVSKLYSSLQAAELFLLATVARTTQKTQPLYCSEGLFTAPLRNNENYSIVACVFIIVGMCLLNSCLAMDVSSDFTIPDFGRRVTICNDLKESCRVLICVLSRHLHVGAEENNEKPQDSLYPHQDSNRVPP
jgi:hypothetical protein